MTQTTIETKARDSRPAANRAVRIDAYRHEARQKMDQNLLEMAIREIPPEQLEQMRDKYAPETRDRLWTVKIMLWFWLMAGLHRERSFAAVGNELSARIVMQIPELAGRRINSGRMAEGRQRVPADLLLPKMLARRA